MNNHDYTARASINFDARDQWGPDQVEFFYELELPIVLGPSKIDRSPNRQSYFHDVFGLDPEETPYPTADGDYPISGLYADVTFQVPNHNYPNKAADKQLERLEVLLRLLQPGDVSVRRHGTPRDILNRREWFSWAGDFTKPVVFADNGRTGYRLDDETIRRLVNLSDLYWENPVARHPSVERAFSRFNSSYERWDPADRLVDLIIALEAMFGDGGDSMTHKVAGRCACWLHSPGQVRWKIFSDVREMYNQRSRVVHGGNQVELQTADVENLENIVRASIVKYLEHYTSENDVVRGSGLDELIMTGEL